MENNLKLTALPKDKLLVLLQRSGARNLSAELLQEDIDAGAPVNADGTINLIAYAAWIIRKANDYGNESE